MMILLAIVCPPVYFLCAKKWGMFFITAIMAFVSLLLIFFIVPTFILWMIAVAMALYHNKQQRMTAFMDSHAEKVGRAVAANLNKSAE